MQPTNKDHIYVEIFRKNKTNNIVFKLNVFQFIISSMIQLYKDPTKLFI